MDYAWALTPKQFTRQDGSVILIDKTKRDEVNIPVDIARDIIKAGRLSAHAQVCDLLPEQSANHSALMRRELARDKKWSPQQLVYISQLHLTTVMLLTGKIKLVEKDDAAGGDKKDGGKDVVVNDDKPAAQTCSEEQKKKVKELITAYVDQSPPQQASIVPIDAAKKAAEATATGSTTPAVKPAAAPATAAPVPAAASAAAPQAKK